MVIIAVFWFGKRDEVILDQLRSLVADVSAENVSMDGPIDFIVGNPISPHYTITQTSQHVLIGRCFSKKNYHTISEEDLLAVDRDTVESFMDDYWGCYLLFLSSPHRTSLTVIKDPVGQIPLFYMNYQEKCLILSTDLSILKEHMQTTRLNWDYLANFVLHGNLLTDQSAFEGINEVVSGCALEIDHHSLQQRVLWKPINYITPKASGPDCDALLIETLENVLRSWISPYKELFLEFSGGLDSSALLFCLQSSLRNDQSLTAVNIYNSRIKAATESFFARTISKEAGAYLHEIDSLHNLPLSPASPISRKPNKPSPLFTYMLMEQELYRLAKDKYAAQWICGNGGDEIFMCPPSPSLISDLVIDRGYEQMWQKINDLSYYYQIPLFSILGTLSKDLIRYGLRLPYQTVLQQPLSLTWMKKDLAEHLKKSMRHPFLTAFSGKISPGKWAQIEYMYKAISSIHQDIVPWEHARFYPLISQPMIECALSLPTYTLFEDGFDRYPFRRAISNHFKTNSVWRKDKGETSGVFQQGLIKNKKKVFELCLEGQFAQHGFIEKNILHETLDQLMHGNVESQWPIIHLMGAEMYIDWWGS